MHLVHLYQCASMGVRQYGCQAVQVQAVWVSGSTGSGSMGFRQYGFQAVQVQAVWVSGSMGFRQYGFQAVWVSGSMHMSTCASLSRGVGNCLTRGLLA